VETIFTSILTAGGVSALLLWLTKAWISERLKSAIKNEYDQKLETHKAQLKAHADIDIEQLKSRLAIIAAERQITFSTLHEKRADVIATTYYMLTEVFAKLNDYIKPYEMTGDPPKEKRRELATIAINTLREYTQPKIIFLPAQTARSLNSISSELVKAFNDFVRNVENGRSEEKLTEWMEILGRLQGESATALSELEEEFRGMLGDVGEPMHIGQE
jgi:hypothetical protein